MERRLETVEKKYDYSMDYARKVLEVGPSVYKRFFDATQLAMYDGGLPKPAWLAAQLVSIVAGDCGPCVQLTVRLAEEAKMPGQQIRAVLEGRYEDLPEDVGLAARFASSLILRDEELPQLRDEVLSRFGLEGQVALAYAVIAVSMYPTLKYAIGFAHPVTTVVVGGAPVSVRRHGSDGHFGVAS